MKYKPIPLLVENNCTLSEDKYANDRGKQQGMEVIRRKGTSHLKGGWEKKGRLKQGKRYIIKKQIKTGG